MANALFIHFKQHLIVGVCVHTRMFMCVMIHSESLKSHGQISYLPAFPHSMLSHISVKRAKFYNTCVLVILSLQIHCLQLMISLYNEKRL